jgi:hypothetical protein
MAKPIQTALAGDALTRQYELQGRQRLSLDDSIVPVAIVSNSSANIQPPVKRSAASSVAVAAVVGEFATFRLEIPPGTLAVVNQITIEGTGSANLQMSLNQAQAGFASIGPVVFTDGRLGNAGQVPAGRLSGGTQVAALSDIFYSRGFGGTGVSFFSEEMDLIITGSRPGQFGFLSFQADNANAPYRLSLNWNEYAVRSS